MPVSLSLAMIVKNEAQVLGRILSQVAGLCDELVVVDTGSTDDTIAIAQSFGAQVVHFNWIDDFSAARNEAFSHCHGDWILWLDADDRLTEGNYQKLLQLKQTVLNETLDAVVCSYQIAFDADGQCLLSIPRERLLRRAAGGRWQFPIHEAYILPSNAVVLNRPDIAIEHHKPAEYIERSIDRNLKLLTTLIEKGDNTPRTWYYYGKELRHHGRLAEAIEAFTKHVALNQEDPTSRYQAQHLAMACCMDLEAYEQAIAWGRQALATDTSRAEAFVNLGVIYYRLGRYGEAIPLLMAATACRKPTSGMITEEDYSWKPFHYLSLCHEGLGDFVSAITCALKAYPTFPDKAAIRDNILCFAHKL